MANTTYALLVGIDTYESPIPPLHGCVADIEAVQTFLEARINRLQVVALKNKVATRQAVIDHFLNHLGQAGAEDTAFFYYSGHGSQAPTAPEFFHLEPDRLDETLVCYDSRMPDNYDLADKEISTLIAEVAKKNPHIVIILDSCHSGSGTRNLASVRRAPADTRQRPLSSYLISPSELETLGQSRSVTDSKSGWLRLPKGRHIVLSACQSDEEAKEIDIAGQTRGVFSYFLLETLQSASGLWSYRDVFARVNAQVRAKVARQSPLIEATHFSDLERPFLGGAVQSHPAYFTVSFDKTAKGWVMDGGEIHGIPPVHTDDTTHLALFPADAANLEALDQAIGDARVENRQPTRSNLSIDAGSQPDPQKTYKAVITALPLPALDVSLTGDEVALTRVRQALATAAPGGGPSLLVREVASGEALQLLAQDHQFLIRRVGNERPLSTVIEGWSEEKAGQTVGFLEHIARWMHMANLHNPVSKLPSNAITMDFYLPDSEGRETLVDLAAQGTHPRLFYEYRDGTWHEPEFRLKLTNRSDRRLYCMLFDLTEGFEIWAEGLLPGGGIWLDPREEAWAYDGDPIPASVPDELWNKGMTEYKDLLKLVVATEACDATRFQQGGLDVRYEYPVTRDPGTLNSLERLMQHVHTRDIAKRPRPGKFADWITIDISITTVRPLD